MYSKMPTKRKISIFFGFGWPSITRTTIKAWMSSNFGGNPPQTSELPALERLKNKLVSIIAPSILIGFSSFLQVTRTTI